MFKKQSLLPYRYPENDVIVQCTSGYELGPGISRSNLQCVDGIWHTSLSQNHYNLQNPSTLNETFLPVNTMEDQSEFGADALHFSPLSYGLESLEITPDLVPLVSLSCSAVCQKPCLNNGTCIGPEKCRCLQGYAGDHCQVEKCFGAPRKIRNSLMIFR